MEYARYVIIHESAVVIFTYSGMLAHLQSLRFNFPGGPFGTLVTFAICGQVITALGWEAAYYVTSGSMIVFWALWVYLIYDTPDQHPGITEKEKLYIQEQIGTSVSKQKVCNYPREPRVI